MAEAFKTNDLTNHLRQCSSLYMYIQPPCQTGSLIHVWFLNPLTRQATLGEVAPFIGDVKPDLPTRGKPVQFTNMKYVCTLITFVLHAKPAISETRNRGARLIRTRSSGYFLGVIHAVFRIGFCLLNAIRYAHCLEFVWIVPGFWNMPIWIGQEKL